jgi:acyl-[acyl-carrier-protein]-phospholipid O-acyltransferase/long-chain-fatty-acid--[acyl-carrier-protein] ligase
MSKPQFDLFKSKRFWPLFTTQFLGAFNDNVFKTALVAIITFGIASSGPNAIAREFLVSEEMAKFLVTLAPALFILPMFLFSALAGQLADKLEKSQLIRRVKMFEIIIMAIGAVGFFIKSVPLLMVVLFLMGLQSTFFGPLKYAIIPDHLKENELIGGNALVESGTFLAILIGTILGGILPDAGLPIVSAMVVIFAVAGFLSARKIPEAEAKAPDLIINKNFLGETFSLMEEVYKREVLYLSIMGISWFWFLGATYLAQFPNYVDIVLNADSRVFTLLLAIFSLGIGLGSMLCNRLLNGAITARFVPVAAIFMALFGVDLYFTSVGFENTTGAKFDIETFVMASGSWRILIDILGIAVAGGVYIVPLYTILQSRSPNHLRARMIAANNIMNALFMVVSAILSVGLLALGFTIHGIFLVISLLSIAAAIYITRLLPQDLIQSIIRTALRVFYRVEVKGIDNYHKVANKAVIIANHTSFLDGLLISAFLPHQLTFAINTHIANRWWVKPAFALFDLLTIDPTNPMSTKAMVKEVKKGRRIVIFPEGRLTVTGALMKVYEGPGMIANLSNAPILPIRIDGAQFTPFSRLKGLLKLRAFPKITLTIEEAVRLEAPEGLSARARRAWLGEALYDLMSNLMFRTSNVDMTLFESVLEAKHMHGRRQNVLEDIERNPINYSKLVLGSFILGGKLKKQAAVRENVGLLLPNSVGAVVTFMGLEAYGRVPAMLNYSTGVKNIKAACKAAEIKTILTSRRFIELGDLGHITEALSDDYQIIYLEDIRNKIGAFSKIKGLLMALTPAFWHRKLSGKAQPDDPAVVLFTSGSEGMPKGVVLSHKNIQSNRLQIGARVDFSPVDTVFNALPIFHSFGLTGGLLLPLLSGLKTFLYPSPLHYRIVPELVYDTNSTIMFGTDTFLAGYARFAHSYDFYSMRYIFAGAEKLKPETRRLYANKFGVRIFEGYGATETAPVLAVNTPMHVQAGTVGRLLPGIEHRLEPVPGIEKGGKLIVSGPNIMKGYLRVENPGVLEEPENGWYDTGDIVEVDAKGFVTVAGRAKRFAKVAGEMVSLTAVEAAASDLWLDAMHAVLAVADAKKGEQLVLLTTHKEAKRDDLRAYLQAEGMSELMVPKHIKYVDEVPVLGTGKTDYVTAQLLADEFAT